MRPARPTSVTRQQIDAAKEALGLDGMTRTLTIYPRQVVIEIAMLRPDGEGAWIYNGELLTEQIALPIRETQG